MAHHTASIRWTRGSAPFTDLRYSRGHTWMFDGGVQVPASSSPSSVPLPMSVEAAVDPEEAFVAALASCHMLWFLAIAAKAGFVIDRYEDEALGTLARNERGHLAMTEVVLRPRVVFEGKAPTDDEVRDLHEHAHDECFL
jgi:organic hydroperoxide reductase OsmC/OhrA